MDEFLRTENTAIFKEWVLMQKESGLTIALNSDDDHIVCLDGEKCHGEIRFNPLDIIEMEIINHRGDSVFYLHFQMGNYNHALDLYRQMADEMIELNHRTHLKILLSCTGGLTTSLFATQLNDGAKVMGFDYEFDAISYTKLYEEGKQYDVLLLAPQIAYKKAEVSKVFPRQIVATIPGVIFATYNVASTFELIKQLVASHHKTHLRAQSTIGLKKDVNNPGLLLSVAVVRHYDETCIHYRLYDHDEIISNHRVVKPRFEVEDLQDGIDAMLAKYPQTAIVGISVPRSIYDDIVMLPLDLATDQEFLEYLKDRYPDKSFYWFNDADSLAVGYYVSQNDYDNLSFMFLPRLTDTGGIGSVFNGQLIVGKETLAGEPGYYLIPFLGDEVGQLSKTVEGTARLIAISLVPVIALLAPDAIVINCVMLPDTKLLKEILMHYFPERFLPDLIKVNALSDYMLIGTMVSCAKSHYDHD